MAVLLNNQMVVSYINYDKGPIFLIDLSLHPDLLDEVGLLLIYWQLCFFFFIVCSH